MSTPSSLSFLAKCSLSALLVGASLCFVIFGQLHAHRRIHLPPAANLALLFLALLSLAYFESGQVAVVNMSTIDERQSRQLVTSHPNAYQVYLNIKHVGTVERYLMGRQLCVIAIVFLISQLTNFPSMESVLPSYFQSLLIETGLPGVMITLIIGQLFPQLIADEYTIRFLNIKGSLFFIKIAEGLENIGIFTNCSWVVSYVLIHAVFRWGAMSECLEGDVENPMDSLDLGASTHNLLLKLRESYNSRQGDSESDSSGGHSSVELASERGDQQVSLSRYQKYETTPSSPSGETLASLKTNATAMSIQQLNPVKSGLVTSSATLLKLMSSTLFTAAAAAVVFYGIFFQKPVLSWPPIVLVLVLLLCMLSEFYLEGMQVAVLAVQHRDPASIPPRLSGTARIHQFITADKRADVVKQFLIGRQFLVVLSMFTVASITSYPSHDHFDQTLIPRKIVGLFVLTGFCGVVFALNTVQLPAQILAKQYPMLFLDLPGVYYFLRVALFIEQTGIMHFGWILFHCSKGFFQYE